MTDYAFAPIPKKHYRGLRELFRRRTNTTVIHSKPLRTGEHFLDHLDTQARTMVITSPVGDLIIGSHGNDRGWLEIDLDNMAPVYTNYEVLEQAVTSGSVNIPRVLRERTDGTLVATEFHIRACLIGRCLPFMQKYKQALGGGTISVTGPLHFHCWWCAPHQGYFEFLGYGFKVARRDRIPNANRAQLLAAFQAKGYKYIDGTNVPNNMWQTWTPNNFNKKKTRVRVYVNLGQTIGTLSRLRVERQFRHKVVRFQFTISGLGANPPHKNARMNALRNEITKHRLFSSSHSYPMYQRHGFSTANDFINGFNWTFSWKHSNLVCRGRRHEYWALIPLTDPTTGNLIFNFYANPGSTYSQIVTLRETDNRLFRTV